MPTLDNAHDNFFPNPWNKFSEEICQFLQLDIFIFNLFSNKIAINFYVFCTFMKDWIILQSAAQMFCQNLAPLGVYIEISTQIVGSTAVTIHMLQPIFDPANLHCCRLLQSNDNFLNIEFLVLVISWDSSNYHLQHLSVLYLGHAWID